MLEKVEELLRALGAHLMAWRREGLTDGRWEGTQLKATADQRAHDFLRDGLARLTPDVPVVSEEDMKSIAAQRPDDYWLIDPIDGTASFCNGFNGFVTQVARMRDAKPVMGLVHAPALDLTYSGAVGQPSRCNGHLLQVSAPNGDPTIIDNYPQPRGIAKTLFETLPCKAYVESGSIGLKICRIADGTADLFVKDVLVKDWDLAPGHLILEGAGGVLTTLDGLVIPYAGSFERIGLVAAGQPELAKRAIESSLRD